MCENGSYLNAGKDGKVTTSKDMQVWEVSIEDPFVTFYHPSAGKYLSAEKSAFSSGDVNCKASSPNVSEKWRVSMGAWLTPHSSNSP